MTEQETRTRSFIHDIIDEDIRSGRFGGRVHTRFPPEPNGYLHIGHAKAICLNSSIAKEYGGKFNLRFDDTNPTKEEQRYIDAIIEDVRWLGADWEDRLFYASDYFQQLYEWAVQLIKDGKAYVDSLSAEEIREYRGTLTEPGRNSPYRDRSVEENLELFEKMRRGEFKEGEAVLRAKIDMSSPNLNMRDPVMYRILHTEHPRTGNKWCIYPMYDWAHGQSDSIEGITHSLCTLEFEDHRPLYDWFLDQLGIYHPRQIEFARLNLTYTVLSKRKLIRLVEEGHVNGWDDPRMPTIAGMRRRGYTPEAIRDFCNMVGVAKSNSIVEFEMLEHAIRQDLNRRAERRMAVLRPLKVVIENYPEGQTEWLEAINNPEDESAGTRTIPFSRELYIEQEDFMEEPVKKFYRLAPGREVRLRYGYFITCTDVVKDENGQIIELRCTYDPETRGGYAPDGRKVKATLHWVSAEHARQAEVRLFDRLFLTENPDDAPEGQDFIANLNPNSLEVVENAYVEPSLAEAKPGDRFQFERLGYFCMDPDSTPEKPVFNRTVALRDTWKKIQQREE
ncbi:MAG TPA: glutamine--tRNA ligase/YqeY domain fusion protein [Aggregatilineales bacterium]|nr:glutamine--tRNA ligase/YqeY domain fusion protein [Chloroflexota bacterium]HOA24521.1 glutamine--tRNA ligase/YqeY domain fusion protein [Aggregatilineales bacterium]HPV08774.1 glutamine--tRNA ligase/YqeY domain fusion protein [Aggregatilineales bacterium]HQA68426.1 glutamine--tRNA ligase/YqeY domain fusion protein [Aggregatilineales bacterium]HQE18017.1 glutamine--tRNA ligase/YqeY domain fusion protein [Aggregatilineales bacterium]